MININNLTKKFKRQTVIDNLSLTLEQGVYGLLGPNGAGKTTFIRCLTNLYTFQGEILYEGESIVNNMQYTERIGYLPQKFGAFRELDVEENLQYFCVLKNVEKSMRRQEINRVLQSVNLYEDRHKKAKNLSGGMLRRLGIAQVLLADPQVMIFDEPTAGLDPEERLRFKMIVSELSRNKTIIISTHIVEDVDSLCERIIVMDKGTVKFDDTAYSLKRAAEGKTFECTEAEKEQIHGKMFLERRFEDDGEIKYRFVASEKQQCTVMKPKIEDGYICVLEEI